MSGTFWSSNVDGRAVASEPGSLGASCPACANQGLLGRGRRLRSSLGAQVALLSAHRQRHRIIISQGQWAPISPSTGDAAAARSQACSEVDCKVRQARGSADGQR